MIMVLCVGVRMSVSYTVVGVSVCIGLVAVKIIAIDKDVVLHEVDAFYFTKNAGLYTHDVGHDELAVTFADVCDVFCKKNMLAIVVFIYCRKAHFNPP